MAGTARTPPQRRPPVREQRPLGSWTVQHLRDLHPLRHSVDAAVQDWASRAERNVRPLDQRLALITSELTSNALKYGAAPVVTSLFRGEDGWVIDVEDAEVDREPVRYPPEPTRAGRNGLLIVERLATRWGWYRSPAQPARRKHLWAWLAD